LAAGSCGEGAAGLGGGCGEGEGFGGDELACGGPEVGGFGLFAGGGDDGLGDLADDGGGESEFFVGGAGVELLVEVGCGVESEEVGDVDQGAGVGRR
jgi:hypothetical protein